MSSKMSFSSVQNYEFRPKFSPTRRPAIEMYLICKRTNMYTNIHRVSKKTVPVLFFE